MWMYVAGYISLGATLLFLMAIILFRIDVPSQNRFIVVAVVALGAATGSAFLSGTAAIEGKIPIPFLKDPLAASATGGIAALVLVMVVGTWLYAYLTPQDDTSRSVVVPADPKNSVQRSSLTTQRTGRPTIQRPSMT